MKQEKTCKVKANESYKLVLFNYWWVFPGFLKQGLLHNLSLLLCIVYAYVSLYNAFVPFHGLFTSKTNFKTLWSLITAISFPSSVVANGDCW